MVSQKLINIKLNIKDVTNMLRYFFGESQSYRFQQTLPPYNLKQMLIRVLGFGALFIVLLTIARTLFNSFATDFDNLSAIDNYLWSSFLLYPLAIITSILCFYPYRQLFIEQLTSLKFGSVLKHTLVLSAFSFVLSYILSLISFSQSDPSAYKEVVAQYSGLQKLFSFSLVFFIQWILVGIGEEITIRGGLYRGLRKFLPQFLSLILMAIIFLLLHSLTLYRSIFILIIAVISGIYFEYKNNLLPIILTHILQDMLIAGTTLYLAAFTLHWLAQ